MTLGMLLISLAVVCVVGATITAVQITSELRARGIAANPLFVRWMIFRYLAQYRQVTLKETGNVGPLYTRCTSLFALGGLLAIAGILVLIL